MVHTHSTSLSFSGEDLFELARFESLESSRIYGYNGMTYFMSIGDGIRPNARSSKDKQEFMKTYKDIFVKNLFHYFGQKDIEISKQSYLIASDTAKEMANKYGWIYREGKDGR
jgi:hypothetical protein